MHLPALILFFASHTSMISKCNHTLPNTLDSFQPLQCSFVVQKRNGLILAMFAAQALSLFVSL